MMTSGSSRPRALCLCLVILASWLGHPLRAASLEGLVSRITEPMEEARLALHGGEPELAESRLRAALLEAWLLRGALDVAEERWDSAREAFEQARDSVANPRRAELALAVHSVRRGDPAGALPWLRSLAARQPSDTVTRRLLAQVLMMEGRTGEAVQELEEALGLVPGDAETLFDLALIHLRTGDLEAADEAFGALVERKPGPATHVLIGRIFLDHSRYDRARRALRAALAADPKARRAHYYLGKIELAAAGYDGLIEAVDRFRSELATYSGDPLASLHLGIALTELRRCDEALPRLSFATENPKTALDAHRFLGKCHLAAGRSSDAKRTLALGLEKVGPSTRLRQLESLHYQLGVALRRLGDDGAAEHFAEAEELSSRLVDEERGDLSAFFDSTPAETASSGSVPLVTTAFPPLESLPAARRDALRLRLDRALARVYSNLATLLARGGRLERAVDLYVMAEERDPSLAGIHRRLGLSAFGAGRYEVAARALVRARSRAPEDPELRQTLALARLNLGRYEEVVELLEADEQRASDPKLQYAYALALTRTGRIYDANRAFEDLTSRHPEWAELQVLIGQARAAEGDFPGAVRALRRALELRPEVPEAHATLGEILLRQGRLKEAEEELRSELEHRPGALQTRLQLAVTLDLANHPAEALKELDRILRAEPEFADARYLMGKILLSEGRPGEARAHLEVAAADAPADANIAYQLAQSLQRLGEIEAARQQFARYRELKAAERGDLP